MKSENIFYNSFENKQIKVIECIPETNPFKMFYSFQNKEHPD